MSTAYRKPVFLISCLCSQTSKSIESYRHRFAYVCHNLIKLIDQADLLLVAFWQLLQMEINEQKGQQTISGMQNDVNGKVAQPKLTWHLGIHNLLCVYVCVLKLSKGM